MPRIPINFGVDSNTDQEYNDTVSAGKMFNMHPEVLSDGKTILRNAAGFEGVYNWSGDLGTTVGDEILSVNNRTFTVGLNGNDWELWELNGQNSATLRGTWVDAASSLSVGRPRMATNGINIVIITTFLETDDYTLDLATNTFVTIASLDADYSSFGKANDVTVINGRYIFVTGTAIFHGDLYTEAGAGLAFNPLSFAVLPFTGQFCQGVEFYSGLIYAIGSNETRIYQDVGTTPFALQLNVSQSIPVGCVTRCAKTVFGNTLYMIGQEESGYVNAYAVTGMQFRKISTNDFSSEVSFNSGGFQYVSGFSDYTGTHIIFKADKFAPNSVYMVEQSQRVGRPVWYDIATMEADGKEFNLNVGGIGSSAAYTVMAYTQANSTEKGVVSTDINTTKFFFGDSASTYRKDYTQTIEIDSAAGSGSRESGYMVTLDYTRNGSDDFSIKKIRLKLIDSNMSAELFYSDGTNNTFTPDDENNFTSLGEITPTANGLVEWRRIGRIPEQRSFRVVLRSPTENVVGGIVEGFIEI